MRAAFFLGLGLLVTACPGTTVLDASTYDQSCTQASDCVLVVSGDVCAVCTCPNDAINAGSLSAWNTEKSRAEQWCGPRPAVACGPCQAMTTSCVSGACAAVAQP